MALALAIKNTGGGTGLLPELGRQNRTEFCSGRSF